MPPSELSRRLRLARLSQSFLVLLMLLAAISVVVGAVNGLHRSQDFQWSGARVLMGHVDPWAEYLKGDPDHRFVATQIPNYLPILYVLILPLGLLSMTAAKAVWVVCNLCFAVGSGWVAARFYGLQERWSIAVVCLLLMATPTRISIGNGQQGLLVLFLWCVALLTARLSHTQAELAGVSYFKFSFGPPVFLYLLFRWGPRAALLSLVPVFAGAAAVWLWITGGRDPRGLVRVLLEPLAVARTGYKPIAGDQNLMNAMDPLLKWWPEKLVSGLELGVAVGICLVVSYFAYLVHREASVRWQMALMATMSYGLFKHHTYDAVVLLLPLCYALRMWRERSAQVVLGLIGYLFYAQRVLEAAHLHPGWAYLVEFGMMMTILGLTYRLREAEGDVITEVAFAVPLFAVEEVVVV